MEDPKQHITALVQRSNLPPDKASTLLARFDEFVGIAQEWEAKAKAIVVLDASQKEDMKVAREGRLLLKGKRVSIENLRKQLKEESLSEGRAIDGVAKALTGLISPIEEYLERQEKFVEIQEKERIAALASIRQSEVVKHGGNPALYNLGMMTEQEFTALVSGLAKAEEDRLEAEAQRIIREAESQREAERVRLENEQLRAQAVEAQRKLNAERAEREKLEAQEKARRDAEALRLKREASEAKKADRAPDKTKIELFADDLEAIKGPEVKSVEAHAIIEHAMKSIGRVIQALRDGAEGL